MKKIFIIGNWKSYKTHLETTQWFQEISNFQFPIPNSNKEIIICVPFTVLALAKSLIQQYKLPIKLGAQNISPFDEGKYTGEVNAAQIAEFAEYVIIGHSERRKYFKEGEEMIEKKIQHAIAHNLIPILCVSELSQFQGRQDSKMIIAYEPLFAIGSGQPDSPENASKVASDIASKSDNLSVIYGGSVTSRNVHSFTAMQSICGVLPGGASLDASEFAAIIQSA